MRSFVVGVVGLALGCAPETSDSAAWDTGEVPFDLPADRARTALANSPDWGTMDAFLDTYEDQTRGVYAWATGVFVAETPDGPGQCSGFLVSERLFVTAAHCEPEEKAKTWKAVWVHFGVKVGAVGGGAMSRRARNHRVEGNWSTNVSVDGKLQPGFYRCRHLQTAPDGQDVAIYECDEGPDGATDPFMKSYPGEVYGWLEVGERSKHTRDEPAWGLSVNYDCDEPLAKRIAPGAFVSHRECWQGIDCFSTTTDGYPGSSGGAVIDANHRVYGVHHALDESYRLEPGYPGKPIPFWDPRVEDRCDETPIYGELINVFLPPMVHDWIARWKTPGTPQGGRTKNMFPIGWKTGSPWVLRCPDDMQGVGLVGSTGIDGLVGNLGILCSTSTRGSLDTVVYAKGAWDVAYRGAEGMPLNAYLSEVRQPQDRVPDSVFPHGAMGMQVALRCPVDHTLWGVTARHGAAVDAIRSLKCVHQETGKVTEVWDDRTNQTSHYIGKDAFGGSYVEATCDVGSNMAGMIVYAGDVTDGFVGICREAVALRR